MAITVSSRPDLVSAAYLPCRYVMTSNKMPNTVTAEINQDVNSIQQVTSSVNTIFGNIFEEGDTIVYLQGSITITTEAGMYVKISGTTDSVYDGVFLVKTVFSNGVFTIDTPYTESSTGGTLSKYYKDFSIVADLYISSAFAVRLRAQVNSDNQFVIDVSRHLQVYLGSDFETLDSSSSATATNTAKAFYIKYAEEYRVPDDDDNPVITLGDFVDDVANTKVAFNTAIQYVDYRNKDIVSTSWDMSAFTSASSTKRFLTNAPTEIKIGASEHYFLTVPLVFVAGTYVVRVDTYNSQNALIATTNFTTLSLITQYRAYNIPAGTANLGATITASTAYYDVYIYNTTFSSQQTEKRRFRINRDCKPLERRFDFLNTLGGCDTFTFVGHESKSTTVERKQYKRGLDAPRVIPERNYTTTQNFAVDTYTVSSGRVDYETAEWLQELFNDVETYVIIDGNRLPVQIVSTTTNVWNTQEGSYNLTFEYRFAFDKIMQRN